MPESFYGRLRRRLEQALGIYVYRRQYLPPGVRLDEDIRRFLPHVKIRTVFDVGANVGQSASQFRLWFPDAQIHCFEPVAATFARMSQRMARNSDSVHLHHVAVGAANGQTTILTGATSDLSRVVPADRATRSGHVEIADMITLDDFCDREGVGYIDFLKIDTEGHDLAVLKGCERLLAEQRVGLIRLETGMTPANRHHVPFEDIKAHLQCRSYVLFGLYEQVHEWTARFAFLRRADPVFVSKRMVLEALAAPQ